MHKKINSCMKKKFFGENLFAYKIRFAVDKKKTILGQDFKITTEKLLCRIWKLYGSIFFKKKFESVFFVTTLFNCSQKAAEMV